MCIGRAGERSGRAGYWTRGEDEKSAEKEERSFAGLDEAPPPPRAVAAAVAGEKKDRGKIRGAARRRERMKKGGKQPKTD